MLANSAGVTAAASWDFVPIVAILALFTCAAAIRLYRHALAAAGPNRIFTIALASTSTACGLWASLSASLLPLNPTISHESLLSLVWLPATIAVIGGGFAVAVYYPRFTVLGGAIVGAGMAIIHYLAMDVLQMSVLQSPPLLVAAAGLAAILFSSSAFFVAARGDHWKNVSGAVGLFLIAIVAQHVLAMPEVKAVTESNTGAISSSWFAVVLSGTMAVAGLAAGFHSPGFVTRDDKVITALDNLHVGVLIFDSQERILVCNKPYREMYNVPEEVVRPPLGSLTSLLTYRTKNQTFREDPQQYLENLRKALAQGSSTHREPRLADGRVVSVSTHPVSGGGWVAIHENISALRQAEEHGAQLSVRDKRRIWLEEAIAGFRARVEALLQSVVESTAAMNGVATALKSSSMQTLDSAKRALTSSDDASSGTASAAAATEELTRAIGEINVHLKRTAETVRHAVSRAGQTNQETATLAAAAEKIGNVVKLIEDITAQTNLLALNATIEAARAGKAGAGFAVVAGEVRALSQRTATATKEIIAQIRAVQNSTVMVVEAIGTITAQMDEIETFSSHAASSLSSQDRATSEISESIAGAAEGTKQAFSVLGQVVLDTAVTHDSAETAILAANRVEHAIGSLREEINTFLGKVHDKANEHLAA